MDKLMGNEPREYTSDEIREMVLEHVRQIAHYWTTLESDYGTKERIEGFAHSMMAMFDGYTIGLPGFLIVPNPAEEDKKYHISEGENWFPIPANADDLCDIGGSLRYGVHAKEEK